MGDVKKGKNVNNGTLNTNTKKIKGDGEIRAYLKS